MNLVIAPKPNMIIYNDTVYKGINQFRELFLRMHNPELDYYCGRHQSNKIAGQALGLIGTIATIFGVSAVTSSGSNKGGGWALIGSGFAATLTGGYLTMASQRNLLTAVKLFNQQHHGASLSIGFSGEVAGLVYKF